MRVLRGRVFIPGNGIELALAVHRQGEAHIAETFAYYVFPETHWLRIRTNNPLERLMREIRRRTRVVSAFPNGHAALMLAAARLRHLAGTHRGGKRYL